MQARQCSKTPLPPTRVGSQKDSKHDSYDVSL